MFGGYAQARRSRVHFIDTHNTYIFPSHMQAQVYVSIPVVILSTAYDPYSDNYTLLLLLGFSGEVSCGDGSWEPLLVSSGAVNKLTI